MLLLFSMGCTLSDTPSTQIVPTRVEETEATNQVGVNQTKYPAATMQGSPPIVSPYVDVIVESVEIRTLGTMPQQIELLIKGTLPDQCKYIFYPLENRGENYVKVTLKGKHPPDTSCAGVAQTIEYDFLLGRDLPEEKRGFAPGSYRLVVNNYQTTFVIE